MWYHFVPNVNITAQTNLPDVNAVISNRRLDLAVRACQTTFIWTSRSRRNDQRTTKTQVEKPGRPRHTWVTQITQDCLTHLTLNSIPKRNFCSSVSNNSLKFTTAHSIPQIQLGTLVSSLIVISLSLTKYNPSLSLSLDIITFLNFAVSGGRPYLDFKTASTKATSVVHSKLDYCNAVLQPSKISNTSSSSNSQLSCPGCG